VQRIAGHDLAFEIDEAQDLERGGEPAERGIERIGVQHPEHGRERVERCDAVPELEETLENGPPGRSPRPPGQRSRS
jgi:hypothetical protein